MRKIFRPSIHRSTRFAVVALLGTSWATGACKGAGTPAAEPASAPAAAAPQPTTQPGSKEWVEQIMTREMDLPSSAMAYAVPGHSGKLLSTEEVKAQKQEGFAYLVANIGTQSPIECFTYDETLDVASAISAAASSVIEETGKLNGGIEVNKLAQVYAGVIGQVPYLAGGWVYRTNGTGQGAQFGFLKVMAAATQHQASFCTHNEPGYTETFKKWFEHFISNYRFATPDVKHRVVEITRDEVNGQPLGFTRVFVSEDSEGDFRVDTMSSLLFPRAGEAVPFDRRGLVYADKDGMLINLVDVDSKGTNLKVDPHESGYVAYGTLAGKEVRFELKTDKRISSPVNMNRRLKQAVDQDGQQTFVLRSFVKEFPDKISEITISEQAADAEGRIPLSVTVGPMTTQMLMRKPYGTIQAETSMGPVKIRAVTVVEEGEY